MEQAQYEVRSYLEELANYLDCLNNEYNDAVAEAESVSDEWDRSVRSYNNR